MTAPPPSDPYAGWTAPHDPAPSVAPATHPGPPGQPYPQAQWQHAGPPPPPEPSPATGWVIAAIIFFWPLAIPAYLASQRSSRALGAGDLATADREGRAARSFGIAAVAVSVVWTLVVVGLYAALLVTVFRTLDDSGLPFEDTWSSGAWDEAGQDGVDLPPGPAGEKSWAELTVGDCFDGPDIPDDSATVPLVPCDDEHVSEVFAVADLPDGAWPGQAVVDEQAFDRCLDEFTEFVGEPYAESSLYLWTVTPVEEGWAYGDREAFCVVEPGHGTVSGTLEGFATTVGDGSA